MMTAFDPLQDWLGIPPSDQPPNHYSLLGLQLLEGDPAAIERGAAQRSDLLRNFQSGPRAAESERLQQEVRQARACLLDPGKKAAYDSQLAPPAIVALAAPPNPQVQPGLPARPRRASAFVEIVKVVLGGVAGLLVAAIGLRLVFGIDVIANLNHSPKRPSSQGSPLALAGEPQPDVLNEKRDSKPKPPAVQEPERPLVVPPNKPAPIAIEPPVVPQPPEVVRPKTPTPVALAEQPEPAKPVETDNDKAPAPAPGKHVVPTPERQAAVRAEIESLYKLKDAKLPADKLKLARELRKVADQSKGSTDERFLLLRTASELAADAADLNAALEVIQILDQEYQFDLLAVQQATIGRFAKVATTEPTAELLFNAQSRQIIRAQQGGGYREAFDIANSLVEFAQKPIAAKWRKQAVEIRTLARRLHDGWVAFQAAAEKLDDSPDDPEANFIAGSWRCVQQNDWAGGLPMIGKGSHVDSAEAAKSDLLDPKTAEEIISCADQWYQLGTKNDAGRGFLARAAHWYSRALPLATGLAKAKVEKRLAELSPALANAPLVKLEPKGNELPLKADPQDPPLATTQTEVTESEVTGQKGYGTEFRRVAAQGEFLVGLHVTLAKYGKNNEYSAIGSIEPVFASVKETRKDAEIGNRAGKVTEVLARPGYVVAGVRTRHHTRMNGLQVVFAPLKGDKLDMTKAYASDWIGMAADDAKVQSCDGKPIVGLTGWWAKESIRSLGVIGRSPPASADTQKK